MATQQASDFTLEHVVGHRVSLADYRGRPVVVIFGGRDSGEQVRQIARTIRDRYGDEELPMISVLDLHGVPRPLHGLIRGRLRSVYQEAVREATTDMRARGRSVPPDMSAAIVLLPDWDGAVTRSFGLSGVDRQAVAVLIGGDGAIRGHGAGAQAGEQILALVGERRAE